MYFIRDLVRASRRTYPKYEIRCALVELVACDSVALVVALLRKYAQMGISYVIVAFLSAAQSLVIAT